MFIADELFKNNDNKAVVICKGEEITSHITFREIFNIQTKLVHFLQKNVVTKHSCIGIFVEHNLYIPAIILSICKTRNCFMFLDTGQMENVWSAVEAVGINYILTIDKTVNLEPFRLINQVTINQDAEMYLWERTTLKNSASQENIMYVVQTSGSTGKRKTVAVEYNCIYPNITHFKRLFKITSKDIIYFGTSLTFDPGMIELFLALDAQACLLITPKSVKLNPNLLHQTMFPKTRKGISFLQIVPSVFLRWTDAQIQAILQRKDLRILAFGGEPFPNKILQYERHDELRVFNLYGVTEVSCWATVFETQKNCSDVFLGQPLDKTELKVVDKDGLTINEGKGELLIGSSERFCYLDNESKTDSTVFRSTGDLVEIHDLNKIKYIGRIDDMIKRFGQRVHLGVLEEKIRTQTGLTNILIWCEKKTKLLLFFKLGDFTEGTKLRIIDKLRVKLINCLEPHCVPDFIELLPKFPVTHNGKVDKNALIEMYSTLCCDLRTKTPSQIFEMLIIKYLGLNPDGFKNHTFFELGGNSILAIQFLNEFKKIILHAEEFVTYLFEASLQDCETYLQTAVLDKREQKTEALPNLKYEAKRNKKSENAVKIEVLWKYNLMACVDASPLIFTNREKTFVAIGSFSNIFAVVDAETGQKIYQHTFDSHIESKPCLSPCRNLLYIGCFDNNMYCIDYLKGEIVWKFKTENIIKCSACYCPRSSLIVFGSYDKNVYALDGKSGVKLWSTKIPGSVVASPLHNIDSSLVYICTNLGNIICLQENTGEKIWDYNCQNPIFGTPCFIEQNICCADILGNIFCISFTGEIIWRHKIDGQIYSSLVNLDASIIFGSHDHHLYNLELGVNGVEITNALGLESGVFSTPCVFSRENKIIAVITKIGQLYLVDLLKNEICSYFDLGGEVYSSPVVLENRIFVGCRDNYLYCLNIVFN